MTTQSRTILEFFAELTETDSTPRQSSIDTSTFRWMPLSYTKLFRGESGRRGEPGPMQDGFADDDLTRRIFKVAQLHGEEGLLRLGWMWVAGTHPEHGTVFEPLATMPVQSPSLHGVTNRLNRATRAGYKFADIEPTGELELTELVNERSMRDELSLIPEGDTLYAQMASPFVNEPTTLDADQRARHQELTSWARRAAAATGNEAHTVVPADATAQEFIELAGLRIVAGLGLYVAEPSLAQRSITHSSTLREWAALDLAGSAFEHLYRDTDPTDFTGGLAGTGDVRSPMRLNPSQQRVVATSERRPITVVSGPPGTGKSQTVAATALHHVRLGRSVLVTAPTNAAVSALTALLDETPGPDPVVFGASARRLDIANRLAEGAGPWFDDAELAGRLEAADRAALDVENLRDQITRLLNTEASGSTDPSEVLAARQQAPGFFDPDIDVHALTNDCHSALSTGSWWRRRRSQNALERLHDIARCDRRLDGDDLARLLNIAKRRQQSAALESAGGLDLDQAWTRLSDAEALLLRRNGEALTASTHHDDRADRGSRRAIAAVASALRAGRSRRRELLAEVSGRQLTEALPLWVATMRDIDDLLPMQTDLFDIVIIDEASHIDQIGAAPALLRANQAMIVGDPRQLRHVSFLSDERLTSALERHGLAGTPAAAQLDVRRQTLFDTAAAVSPVTMLDEHYRSAPHLIAFSAHRFYDDALKIATRHPRNDRDDRIDVLDTDGTRGASGSNMGEVDMIVSQLRLQQANGATSVGVVSPFRAQADAIENAVLDQFDLATIEAMDLRIGTVHAFQGCQRDTMYLSLTADETSPRGSWSFMSEATLFNVMITRARERVYVVTSTSPPANGVVDDYLRHAIRPSPGDVDNVATRRWTQAVGEQLGSAGVPVTANYPSGRHHVDLVVGEGVGAVALTCGVHTDGAQAHISRQLDLMQAGWTVFEIFETRWGDHLAALAIDMKQRTS